MKRTRNAGFTLVELLVVIAKVAWMTVVLVLAALPAFAQHGNLNAGAVGLN